MKVLLINKFLYKRGGDAVCALNTGELLASHGHRVTYWGMDHPLNPTYRYDHMFVSNVDFNNPSGTLDTIRIALNILYSVEAKKKLDRLIAIDRPDIAHLHNFAHQISPSILDVFQKYDVPVVMTLHDFKIVCPSYLLLNNGFLCEACKMQRYYQCLLKKCVKSSRLKSFINTLEMYLHHKWLHIYDVIDTYISPSIFLKEKCREMGFTRKIVYLPNFIMFDDFQPSYNTGDAVIIYVGRLSCEKGIEVLIDAVRGLRVQVHIIGTGPSEKLLKKKVARENLDNIFFLGHKEGNDLRCELMESRVSVLPSMCYENNPRAILEAFALGTPVIGASIGGIPELVTDYQTGLTFEPGNADDLREKIRYVLEHKHDAVEMGRNARKLIETNFHPANHYASLMKIYQDTLKET